MKTQNNYDDQPLGEGRIGLSETDEGFSGSTVEKRNMQQNRRIEIGNRLRALRLAKDLTQVNVAMSIDINDKTYAAIERGTREMKIETLLKLAAFYQVSCDYILTGSKRHMDSIMHSLKSLSWKDKDAALTQIGNVVLQLLGG